MYRRLPIFFAHLAVLLLTTMGISPLWETGLEAPPRGGPLLVPDGRRMVVVLPLGDHGLAGWDSDGAPLPGFPVSAGGGVILRPAVFSSPADGLNLIAYSTDDGAVHAVDLTGREASGWPFRTGSTVVTGISAVDLDTDGIPELAFGTSDNRIHLLDPSGSEQPGWPVAMEALLLWQPCELPLGGGCNRGLVCALNNARVFILDHEGFALPGWPINPGYPVGSIPVTIDMNSDGSMDVVFATQNRQVLVYDIQGERVQGWPFQLDARPVNGGAAVGLLGLNGTTPSFAVSTVDSLVYLLNGDGSLGGTWKWPNFARDVPTPPIIIETVEWQAVVTGTGSGRIMAWDADGSTVDGFPLETGMSIGFAPAAGDLNGDGVLDLVVAGTSGLIAAYTVGVYGESIGSWPQTLGGPGNSGMFASAQRPIVEVGQISGEHAGTVTIPYCISDGESMGMTVAYSTSAGFGWTETRNYRNTEGAIEWFTDMDLPSGDETQCRIKITPWCAEGPGESGMSTVFHVDNNISPTIYVAPLFDMGEGWLLIPYAVEDPEGDIVQLQAEFSRDGGGSWNLAHLSGTAQEIEPWFYGDPVTWNAVGDLGKTPFEGASLRIRAADRDPGSWVVFGTGLRPDEDRIPSGQVIVSPGEFSGLMNVGIRFADPERDPLEAEYEFSPDNGVSWYPASVTGIETGAAARNYPVVVWESRADLPDFDGETVMFRVLPADSTPGVAVPSAPFHLDNNSIPSVTISSPGAYDVFSGLVPVRFSIRDTENDPVTLGIEFRIQGSEEWMSARGLGYSGPFTVSSYDAVLRWNSSQDLPEARILDIDLRILASDGDTVYSEIVSPVTINNTGLPSVTQAAVTTVNETSGMAAFSFELFDPDERTLDLMVDFSTDNGLSWREASVSGDLFELSSWSYRGMFQWSYRSDLTGGSGTVLLRITPASGDDFGRPLLLDLAPG
jgi:hypothetical protein